MQTMGKQTLNHQVSECCSVQKMPMSASFSLKSRTGLLIPIPPCIYLATNNKYGFMGVRPEGLTGCNKPSALLLVRTESTHSWTLYWVCILIFLVEKLLCARPTATQSFKTFLMRPWVMKVYFSLSTGQTFSSYIETAHLIHATACHPSVTSHCLQEKAQTSEPTQEILTPLFLRKSLSSFLRTVWRFSAGWIAVHL